ncbi:MAG: DUF2391 family protein [Candidatus Aenigmarchaeota archaeon]|nr:DUF2391 family protein [Candidatus Aenigmarchaeota archaeon]
MRKKQSRKSSTTDALKVCLAQFSKLGEEVELIKQILQRELPPEHFSSRDIVRSFFGAAFLGVTFVFSKNLAELVPRLDNLRLLLIVLSTFFILTFEIYYIGYQRVRDPERKFFQFWFKRVFTFYIVAVFVSFHLSYIYGLTTVIGAENIIKLVIAMSMPCAIGASITDLLKKY